MLQAIVDVWATVGSAIVGYFNDVVGIFWDSSTSSLTFVGVLAVIMAAVGILLLVFNLIRSFFPMRG